MPDIDRNHMPYGHHDQVPNRPLRELQGESDYSGSSRPLLSMYCKIAEEEDNKMVEHCQNDSLGILIFSGLLSVTVGALLTITIPDLKSNSQDTSAFYLRNIYQVLGNPDVSPSIPSALAEPPAFSPPKYAIWVNSLWFLSLAVSLSCATETMILRNWAVQYISVTRPPYSMPKKQARISAVFAKGNPGPNAIWGTGLGPILLHLSLFLFIAGGLIYLFNINRSVFYAVVWWVGYMAISYAGATMAVFFEAHNLLHTPLSPLALRFYLGISYGVFQVCSYLPPSYGLRDNIRKHYRDLSDLYKKGLLNGKRRAAREIASKPSSEIDALILERIFPTLDEDHALETFLNAIPGFCHSKLTKMPLSSTVQLKLRVILDALLDRTFSPSLISESVRTGQLITCLNAAHVALGRDGASAILDRILNGHWDEALQSVEIGHALRLWGHSRDYDLIIQRIVACIVGRGQISDRRWHELVEEVFGVPNHIIWSITPMDNVLLFILIYISRKANRASSWASGTLSSLPKFDIHNTLFRLQDEFCAMWNDNVRDARNQGLDSIPTKILREIRHLYIALHLGTDDVPTAFSASTDSSDLILMWPSSYPLCKVSHHHPQAYLIPPLPRPTLPRLQRPPLPRPPRPPLPRPPSTHLVPYSTSLGQIGDSSLASTATSPVLPTDAPPPAAPPTSLSYPPEKTTQQDIGAPSAKPDIGETRPRWGPYLTSLGVGEIRDSSRAPTAISPIVPIYALPPAVPPPPPLSYPPEITTQQDTGAPSAKPDIDETRPRWGPYSTSLGVGEIRDSAHAPTATSPVLPTDALLPAVPPPLPLSYPPEITTQQDTGAPSAKPDIDETRPRWGPYSTSLGVGEIRDSSHTPIPTSPIFPTDAPPPAVGLEDVSPPAPLSYPPEITTQQDIGAPSAEPDIGEILSTSDAKRSPLRVRGLVDSGSRCFVNAVLQLLVHSPLFWNLFGELGNLMGQRGAGGAETAGDATPLVDATVRFFEEFVIKEESPPTQQTASGKLRDAKKEHIAVDSFEPTYMYDAMEEKRQLKILLDGQQEDAEEFFRLYLDALDEELLTLLASIGGSKSATAAPGVEEREVSQSGLTDVAESVESPLMQIFGGKFSSTERAPIQPDTVTSDYWRSLHLDIQPDSVHTIQDALTYPQPMQVGQPSSSEASQQVLFEALPPVLVLHLKRFFYDAIEDSIVKISKPLKFTPELEIPPELMAPVFGKSVHYKLYGVLYHQGESTGSAHYTVDVLHPNGDSRNVESWLHIDDEAVSAVRHEDVFRDHDNGVDDRCAYMLFYSQLPEI